MLSNSLQLLLFLAVLYFLGSQVQLHWDALPGLENVLSFWLILSWVVGLLGCLAMAFQLKLILGYHGVQVTLSRAVGLYFIPAQGKYLPGKVWALVWATAAYQRIGASLPTALASLVTLTVLNLVSALFVGLVFGGQLLEHRPLWTGLGVSFALVMHPRIFYGLINGLQRSLGKEPLAEVLSLLALAKLFVVNVSAWVLLGIGFTCLLHGTLPVTDLDIAKITSAQSLAYAVGLLAFFAPAGLGVREGAMTVFLAPLLGIGAALASAALGRIWQIALELPCVAYGFLVQRGEGSSISD